MPLPTEDLFNARYKAITDPLPKDENGFVGTGTIEKYNNMWIYFLMAWNGCSEEEARAMRKKANEDRMEIETQQSIAQVWP
jgi:hypothetical protein